MMFVSDSFETYQKSKHDQLKYEHKDTNIYMNQSYSHQQICYLTIKQILKLYYYKNIFKNTI